MKKLMMILLSLTLVMSLCLCTACVDRPQDDPQEPEYSAPVITIANPELSFFVGQDESEVDLLFDVTVTDEYDSDLTASITDDGGLDYNVVGVYTVSYSATNSKGKEGTATRTVNILAPLPAYVVKAQKSVDTNKWAAGDVITFKNELFHTLTENYTNTTAPESGIFYNASEGEIVISITGGGGEAAIVDASGFVIEGRDGANGKLVNAANPSRANSKVTSFEYEGETYAVSSKTYTNMVVPAGGFAIIVHQGYAGEGFDFDGRFFMANAVIGNYGSIVKIYKDGETPEEVTAYKDQAPLVKSAGDIEVSATEYTAETIEAVVLEGIDASDDNGTFELADDVAATVAITAGLESFNGAVAGEYVFTLTATDALGNVTTFNRTVFVMEGKFVTLTVGANSISKLEKKFAIDQNVTNEGEYSFIIYTPAYNKEQGVNLSDYGAEIYVTDKYGVIVYIFDGINAGYYDADHIDHTTRIRNGCQNAAHAGGNCTTTNACTAAGAVAEATALWMNMEGYLIIAPYNDTNKVAGESHKFMQDNRANTVGKIVTVTGIEFAKDVVTATANEKSIEINKKAVAVNPTTVSGTANELVIYTAAEKANVTVPTAAYGYAFILNAYGEVEHIFDGCSGKYVGAVEGAYGAGLTAGDFQKQFLTLAFSALTKSQMLVYAVNVGGANTVRNFFWKDAGLAVGTVVEFDGLGVKYAAKKDVVTIDGAVTEYDLGTVVVDAASVTANKTNLVVYTDAFTGTPVANGYGCAVVLNSAGQIVRVYDGANGGYWDEVGQTVKKAMEGWGSSNYLATAVASLQAGEIVVAGLNGGMNGNAGRGLMLSCRQKVGKVMTLSALTDWTFGL